MITRRTLAGLTASALLAACTSGNTTVTEAQIIADANGLVATIKATVAAIVLAAPTAIPAAIQAQLATYEAAATAALATLSASATPASTALTLQTIEAYLNPALAAIGSAIAVVPILAQYAPIYAAADALLVGVIEPYIASVLANGTPPAPTPAFNQQRQTVGVRVVGAKK